VRERGQGRRTVWRCETGRGDVADLKKVSRILLDLKVTENYLRQYPHLAEKVAAALAKGTGHKG
jgi:hypothetical protein